MARDDREKLSNRISKGGYVFGHRIASFAEAFPTIASLQLEVADKQMGDQEARRHVITERAFRSIIDCSNPLCYGGGVDVGPIIHELVAQGKTDDERSVMCRGYEGSPKGRKKYRSCMHIFRIRTHIEYLPGHHRGESADKAQS